MLRDSCRENEECTVRTYRTNENEKSRNLGVGESKSVTDSRCSDVPSERDRRSDGQTRRQTKCLSLSLSLRLSFSFVRSRLCVAFRDSDLSARALKQHVDMQRINESQAKTKSTRSVGQMRIIYSFSSQYKNVAVYMTMSAKLRRSKLNMATSGTILSLPARRSLRKPSDGAVAEQASSGQRVRRESDARLGQSRAASVGHVVACRAPARFPHLQIHLSPSVPRPKTPKRSKRGRSLTITAHRPSPPCETEFLNTAVVPHTELLQKA